ncbi:calcium-binding protein [Crocosphaera sp.]|uniref:calcium-binding protein n=1 Tax=Crocosphaera sp. TaxID=2729996 RepID=UPI00257D9345|nr:calcium-binding protein [Crocosphaera sp.]NQZ65171.1 calcium-binding protein [Crocosphaera sp.]
MINAALETGEKFWGTDGNDTIAGGEGNDTIGGGNGDDSLSGNGGNDRIMASHGDDQVSGGEGNDRLWGGNGNDTVSGDDGDDTISGGMGADILDGGEGNDRIISRSDAGVPDKGHDHSQMHPHQPSLDADDSLADDTLIGGSGADTFRFELLLNAKEEIIKKHADPVTGKVNWKNVAGENGNAHDHWVDRIGNETILDFNKSEGDKIEIVGHTVKVDQIEYKDVDGDGINESIIYLISDQGDHGGAHNKDELGTITVYGDKVEESDLKVNAGVYFGAFTSIYKTVGTDENDLISGTDNKDTIDGGDGDDTLNGEAGNDRIFAGDGDDLVSGGDGKDKLWGNVGNDTISGGDGDDTITGGDGDDVITGEAGKDRLWGNADNDKISGGDDNDTLGGGDGDDTLNGDAGNDKIWAGDGNDLVSGGEGSDRITGDGGNDSISGGENDDTITGGDGDDTITGDAGNDKLWGDGGNDSISGGEGDDMIWDRMGEDVLDGGEGNDILISRSDAGEPDIAQETDESKVYPDQPFLDADDTLIGGLGADTFRFELLLDAKDEIVEKHADPITGKVNWRKVAHENDNVHDHWVNGIGNDTILDFNKSEGDQIRIAGHTVQVDDIEYLDLNADGIDESIIHLISNQGGNGGAHDQDKLGTITVYGDLVEASDLTVNAGVFYGAFNAI